MGRFLDEEPNKTYKGRFLDEEPATPYVPKGKFLDEAPIVPEVIPPKSFGKRFGMIMGPTVYGAQPGAEDLLPAIGQTAGGKFGLLATAGASAGEIARQGVKAIRGDVSGFKKPLNVGFGGVGLPSAIPSVGREAATTLTVEGITRGTGKLLRPVANRMMQSALKASVPIREKYPQLGIEALEEGIYGTRGQMLKKAETIAKTAESDLQKLLSGRPEKVNLKNVVAELGEMRRRALNIGDESTLKQLDEFEKVIMSKSETVPVTKTTVDPFKGAQTIIEQQPTGMFGASEANQLKRDFYSQVSDPAFLKKVGDLSQSPEMYRRGAQGLRKEIVEAIPEAGKLDKSASTAIKAKKALQSEEARSMGRVMLPFFEIGGAGTALATGNPGIAALIGARRLMEQPFVKSLSAKALLELSKRKALGTATRTGAAEFGRRVFGS